MEGLSNDYQVRVQQPVQRQEFTGNPYASMPEQIEDGDNKLKNALIALGATAAAGVVLYKTGALGKTKEALAKHSDKAINDTTHVIKKGSREAIENSQKVIKGVSEEAQESVNKAKNKINSITSLNASETQTKNLIEAYNEAIKKAEKGLVKVQGQEMSLDKAKGHLQALQGKGDIKLGGTTYQGLKKIQSSGSTTIQQAKEEIINLAKTNADAKGVIEMQRAARKHPQLSESTLKKIQETSADANRQYCQYNAQLAKKGKAPITMEQFQKILQRAGR